MTLSTAERNDETVTGDSKELPLHEWVASARKEPTCTQSGYIKYTCTTCTDERTVSKRQEVKRLIAKLKEVNPQVEFNIFRSVENVSLNQLIAYKDDSGRHSFLERFPD